VTACAIMQPTYLPWAGFFNLIAASDVFVVLDDVQFRRASWHSRNRIVLGDSVNYLTVPVERSGLHTKLSEARVNYNRDWRRSHEGQLVQAYKHRPGGALVMEVVRSVFRTRPERLLDLNLGIIEAFCSLLNIQTQWMMASDLGVKGQRSSRLISICVEVGAQNYLSPAGSARYLEEDGFINGGDVLLHLQDFEPREYDQGHGGPFIPSMSIVDIVANIGPESAAEYVSRPSFPSYEGGKKWQ